MRVPIIHLRALYTTSESRDECLDSPPPPPSETGPKTIIRQRTIQRMIAGFRLHQAPQMDDIAEKDLIRGSSKLFVALGFLILYFMSISPRQLSLFSCGEGGSSCSISQDEHVGLCCRCDRLRPTSRRTEANTLFHQQTSKISIRKTWDALHAQALANSSGLLLRRM